MGRAKPEIYCDVDGCKAGARWRLDALDGSNDYFHACNVHLGKICEQIVRTSKVKYDIVHLALPTPVRKARRKSARVKVVQQPAAETVTASPAPSPRRRRRKKTTGKKSAGATPRTRKKRW